MGIRLDTVKESLLAELTALDGLSGDELKQEIARARAKVEIAGEVNAFVSNQIAVTKIVVQTRGQTSESINRAVDNLIGLPEGES